MDSDRFRKNYDDDDEVSSGAYLLPTEIEYTSATQTQCSCIYSLFSATKKENVWRWKSFIFQSAPLKIDFLFEIIENLYERQAEAMLHLFERNINIS